MRESGGDLRNQWRNLLEMWLLQIKSRQPMPGFLQNREFDWPWSMCAQGLREKKGQAMRRRATPDSCLN